MKQKIISIIRKLSPNKAHGCDDISIRMLKICDTVIARPLKIIYEKCIETDRFPLLWKKSQYCASTQEKQSPNHEKLPTYLAPPEKFLKKSSLTKFTNI